MNVSPLAVRQSIGALLARKLTDHGFLAFAFRYILVSAAALALDVAVFMTFLEASFSATGAAAAGFLAGTLLHFGLSTRVLIRRDRLAKSDARLVADFVLSGSVGLAVTGAVVFLLVEVAGLAPGLAKLIAIAASFVTVFAIRQTLVFRHVRAG